MSDTIVPEVKLEKLQADIRRAVLKSIADNDVLELVIHVPVGPTLDLNMVGKLRRHGAWMTLSSGQLAIPTKGSSAGSDSPVAAGQLTIDDINADAMPDGPEPTKYSLLLLELPSEEKQLKAAKKWLRKHTGLKAADLDVELEALAAGAGYLVIEGGNEPFVMETRMEMERLGMVVSTHPWARKSGEAEDPDFAPVEPAAPTTATKVTVDQLTVGSQWLLKGIGTQVRIHNIQGEKVYFHSLYALYSSLPAWVFAAAVTPSDVLVDLEAVDLAKWEDAPIKPVQLDPETEARLQEPWLMPVVELPLDAEVEYQGKRWMIADVAIQDGKPMAILDSINGEGDVAIAVGELVEPLRASFLSHLVFGELADAQQADQDGASDSTDIRTQHDAQDLSPETEQGGNGEALDPTPSTAASDGGEVVGTEEETEDTGEREEGEPVCAECQRTYNPEFSSAPGVCGGCAASAGDQEAA